MTDLSTLIRERFTPFAFTCPCNGAEPDCYRTRTQDTYAIATAATIKRIVTYLEELGVEYDG